MTEQQLVPFQPTYSQGIGSLRLYQAPVMPPMEASPQDYRQSPQYAPTNQYSIQPRQAAPLVNASSIDSGTPTFQPTQPVSNSTSAIQYDPSTQRYSSNPSYAPPPPPAAEVDYDEGGEGEKAGGRIRAYARGGSTPQGLASLGRGQDSMLVHMSPNEVQGLQQLAMSAGGSLTINPQTGLPEAGFLSSLLPMLAGVALAPMTAGTSLAFLGTPMGAALTVGGISALTSGSLKKGLMAGLGAYGGANLGQSLTGMGAEQANALASQELTTAGQAATTTGNNAADSALKFAEANKQAEIEKLVRQATANPDATMNPTEYRDFLTKQVSSTVAPTNIARPIDFVANPYSQEGIGYMQSQGSTGADIAQMARESAANASPMPAYNTATQEALARGPVGNMYEGFTQLGSKEGLKTLGGKLGYAGAASLAAPLLSSAMEPGKFNPPAKTPTQYSKFDYRPPKYNPETGNYDPASYGPGSYYTNPTQYAAQGGAVGYDQGGIARFYPLTGDKVNMSAAPGGLGGAGEKRKYSLEINDPDSGAGINDNKAGLGVYSDVGGIYENTPSDVEGLFAKTSAAKLSKYLKARSPVKQAAALAELRKRANAVYDYADDTISAAQGGLMGLNTYAAGGKLLRGPGDGMSDSIPAVIRGARPQRAALADGEFVIPADVVSHLGNGSTEAGSKRLYSMMDKVRKARTGNPKQGKQINPDRFMPA
jgi:hypothetical protein